MRNSAFTCDTSTFICSFPLTYFFGVLTFLDYFFIPIFTIFSFKYFVGDKAKGRISNRVFQENKARQIFRKRTFLTLWYAHVPFALLPKIWHKTSFGFYRWPWVDSRGVFRTLSNICNLWWNYLRKLLMLKAVKYFPIKFHHKFLVGP